MLIEIRNYKKHNDNENVINQNFWILKICFGWVWGGGKDLEEAGGEYTVNKIYGVKTFFSN